MRSVSTDLEYKVNYQTKHYEIYWKKQLLDPTIPFQTINEIKKLSKQEKFDTTKFMVSCIMKECSFLNENHEMSMLKYFLKRILTDV